jgi:hypothetical protein
MQETLIQKKLAKDCGSIYIKSLSGRTYRLPSETVVISRHDKKKALQKRLRFYLVIDKTSIRDAKRDMI